jgi:hypothetical protein
LVHQNSDNKDQSQKLEWVKPELRRMEAGSAENQRGLTADGGGGNQGS